MSKEKLESRRKVVKGILFGGALLSVPATAGLISLAQHEASKFIKEVPSSEYTPINLIDLINNPQLYNNHLISTEGLKSGLAHYDQLDLNGNNLSEGILVFIGNIGTNPENQDRQKNNLQFKLRAEGAERKRESYVDVFASSNGATEEFKELYELLGGTRPTYGTRAAIFGKAIEGIDNPQIEVQAVQIGNKKYNLSNL
ncbi:hypothetical protein CMI42_02130 [Candidatus Pacearchaeota archaeon]|nr:hypothetical protein [Candidatus Pacearchaeota archaeon]